MPFDKLRAMRLVEWPETSALKDLDYLGYRIEYDGYQRLPNRRRRKP
jgi:hypothetical protein